MTSLKQGENPMRYRNAFILCFSIFFWTCDMITEDVQKEVDDLRNQVEALQTEIDDLENEVSDLDQANTDLEQANAELQVQLQAAAAALQATIDSLSADLAALSTAVGDSDDALLSQIEELQAIIEELQQQLETLNSQLVDLQSEIDDLEGRLAEIETRTDSLGNQVVVLWGEIATGMYEDADQFIYLRNDDYIFDESGVEVWMRPTDDYYWRKMESFYIDRDFTCTGGSTTYSMPAGYYYHTYVLDGRVLFEDLCRDYHVGDEVKVVVTNEP